MKWASCYSSRGSLVSWSSSIVLDYYSGFLGAAGGSIWAQAISCRKLHIAVHCNVMQCNSGQIHTLLSLWSGDLHGTIVPKGIAMVHVFHMDWQIWLHPLQLGLEWCSKECFRSFPYQYAPKARPQSTLNNWKKYFQIGSVGGVLIFSYCGPCSMHPCSAFLQLFHTVHNSQSNFGVQGI
jgi:hypothetical protein